MFDGQLIITSPARDRLSPGPLGVRRYVKHLSQPGYTLFSPAFGYQEYLIDRNGMVVHTWPVRRSQLAQLLSDGSLIVDNYAEGGLDQMDPDGNTIWQWRGPYHHDFYLYADDSIAFMIGEDHPPLAGFYDRGYEPESMRCDVAMAITRDGELLWRFPLRDHVDELHNLARLPIPCRYASLMPGGDIVERANSDWTHTNTLEVLPDTPLGRQDRRFRQGNILLSFRSLDIIAIADVEADEIVWAWGLGEIDGQHQPTMTAEGTILLFDNGTARGYSRVLELDPRSNDIIWSYEDRSGFFSAYRSGVQRLANGNTLVAESDAGRIFELTPQQEIVWDYHSPFLGQGPGNQGRHVYRATRLSDDEVRPLVDCRSEEQIVGVSTSNQTQQRLFPDALRFYRDGLGG